MDRCPRMSTHGNRDLDEPEEEVLSTPFIEKEIKFLVIDESRWVIDELPDTGWAINLLNQFFELKGHCDGRLLEPFSVLLE